MSGVWTVPVVELDKDENEYYKLIKTDELSTFPSGGAFGGMKFYPFIFGVANASYRIRAQDMVEVVGQETFGLMTPSDRAWLLGVIELSKDEHSNIRNTWYRLIAAGRDSDAEELFWNVTALNRVASKHLTKLVDGLSSWGELDEWGVPVDDY